MLKSRELLFLDVVIYPRESNVNLSCRLMTNDTIRSEADDYLVVNGILDNLKKYTQTP